MTKYAKTKIGDKLYRPYRTNVRLGYPIIPASDNRIELTKELYVQFANQNRKLFEKFLLKQFDKKKR